MATTASSSSGQFRIVADPHGKIWDEAVTWFKKGLACRFAAADTGCRLGDSCKFRHGSEDLEVYLKRRGFTERQEPQRKPWAEGFRSARAEEKAERFVQEADGKATISVRFSPASSLYAGGDMQRSFANEEDPRTAPEK